MDRLFKVRPVKASDELLLNSWLCFWQLPLKASEMYPLGASFILEKDGQPFVAVSCYRVEAPRITYMEGILRNPSAKSDKEAIRHLQEHVEQVERARGTTRLVALTNRPDLNKFYTSMGYNNRIQDLFLSVKEL